MRLSNQILHCKAETAGASGAAAFAERPCQILFRRKKENKEKGRQPIRSRPAKERGPQKRPFDAPSFLFSFFSSNESFAHWFGVGVN
jgi:hypothetical protein